MTATTKVCAPVPPGKAQTWAIGSTLLLVCGLVGPLAWCAPGDLDPAFGDVGRVTDLPGLSGAIRSIRAHGDGFIVGGGDLYQYSSIDPTLTRRVGFVGRIAASGALDPAYALLSYPLLSPDGTLVTDVAVQSDGTVIGLGQSQVLEFAAFRLLAEGGLDTTFGENGFVRGPEELGLSSGESIVLDDLGRSVIAAQGSGGPLVIRLLPTGEVDSTFGAAGVFTPQLTGPTSVSGIVRVPGGYRVTLNGTGTTSTDDGESRCWITALRDDGTLDTTFDDAGYAALDTVVPGSAYCTQLSALPDGRVVVGGAVGDRPFVVSILEGGARDAGFDAPAVKDRLTMMTALAAAADGSVLVAGRGEAGVSGALVVRLRPDGRLDASFGNAGDAWIELPAAGPIVRDILPLAEGAAVVAGGYPGSRGRLRGPDRPFAARLLGDTGAAGPGVIGVEPAWIAPTRDQRQAVVTVFRRGGSAGAVSVAYGTAQFDSPEAAIEGQDYVATNGRLEWSDGDSSPRQIVVPLLMDDQCAAENDEPFQLELSDPQGGTGLGVPTATIVIAGHPAAGIVELDSSAVTVRESQGTAAIKLRRDGNIECAVSVTMTVSGATATADSDFQFEATTLDWASGDSTTRTMTIPIIDDDLPESRESFEVTIESASIATAIGTRSSATVTIDDDDGSSSSGGGRFGFVSTLLLGLTGAFRAFRRRVGHAPP